MNTQGIDQLIPLLRPDFGALFRGELAGITAAIFLILVGIFCSFLVYALRQRHRAKIRIRHVRALIDGVRTEELVTRRQELRVEAEQEDGTVRHLWREFDETLVESPDGRSLWNTLDAEHFFNSQALAPKLMHNRMLLVLPSILTALGVLGTFIGLTTGLNGLDLGTGATVDELRAGINQLISSAAVAFMTSVYGVFLSLLTNFIEKGLERDIAGRISGLQNQVDELFKRHAPEQSLVSIMDTSKETSVSLQELHEKIGSKLQEAVKGLSTDLQTTLVGAIETAMAPSMERLAAKTGDQAMEVFEQLVGKFASSFEQIGAQQAERMDSASAGLTSAVDSLSSGTSTMLTDIREGAEAQRVATAEQSAQFSAQVSELTALVTQQAEVLDASLTRIVTSMDSASTQMAQTTDNVAKAAIELNAASDAISVTASQFKESLGQNAAALAEIGQHQETAAKLVEQHALRLSALQTTALAAADKLTTAAGAANEGFVALRSHQNQFLDNLRARIDGLNESMARWLENYSATVVDQTSQRMNVWNEHSRDYASQMLTAVSALSELVDEMGGNGREVSPPTAVR